MTHVRESLFDPRYIVLFLIFSPSILLLLIQDSWSNATALSSLVIFDIAMQLQLYYVVSLTYVCNRPCSLPVTVPLQWRVRPSCSVVQWVAPRIWFRPCSVQLPDLTSIFRAELYALFLAIDVIRRSKLKKFVIFSDSLSSLQAIAGFNIDDLVQKFIKEYSVQTKQGKPSLYVGFQVMLAFLEMRRLILLQKMAFLSLLLH